MNMDVYVVLSQFSNAFSNSSAVYIPTYNFRMAFVLNIDN
jgi:hypothetical protein